MLRSIARAMALALILTPSLGLTQTLGVPETRLDQNARPPHTKPPAKSTAARGEPPNIAAFQITRVVIEGSSLPAASLRVATDLFEGRTLTGADLVKVSDAVAAVYARSDIAIYTVVVPRQDFAGGVLRLRALEGYVEGSEIRGPAGRRNRALAEAYLARLKTERPLRRSTLQRYISLLRDIPGLTATTVLTNGSTDAGVRLQIDLTPHPAQVGLAINNRGTAYLGRTQIQADLYLNSVFRQGDQTRFTVATPTDTQRFQSYGLAHSQPLDDNGTTLQLNAGYLRTKPVISGLMGHATSFGLQVSHPIVRSYDRDLIASIGVDGLNSDNAFLGFRFSDDRTRALRGALAYSREAGIWQGFVSGSASLGLDGLGARSLSLAATRLDFRKANLRAGYSRQVGPHTILRLNAAGQWTSDRLPAAEQFALGGEEFGRGYFSAVVAGDRGYGGSFEAAYRPARLPATLEGSEAYAFIDGGRVWYLSRLGFPTTEGHLSSVGAGVRLAIRNKAVLGLEAAGPIDDSLAAKNDPWRGVFTLRSLF